ncbi:MAG: sensor histidine kinase [Burkholderiaceae bacterium]|nr:sensor histidine kinase [Burkholderiaceae bacterium]
MNEVLPPAAADTETETLARHWQATLDEWPVAAMLVDDRLRVLAANGAAQRAGVQAGAHAAQAAAALAGRAGAARLPLRWLPVQDDAAFLWLIDVLPGRSGDCSDRQDIAQRLAASNLRLQEEIARRRTLERQLLTVAENEKQRISLELHDGLGQHLTGATFVARTLADRLRAAGCAESAEADWLVQLLNEAIARTRALARGLWPVSLERESLAASIAKLAEDLEAIFGVSCAVQVVDAPRIVSPFVAHHIFRIVQEAANNAMRHARARRLTFRLEAVGETYTVCVINDGLPLDPQRLENGGGLGVVGMRLRAEAIGGELSIEPLPDGGAEVTLSLPGLAGGQTLQEEAP